MIRQTMSLLLFLALARGARGEEAVDLRLQCRNDRHLKSEQTVEFCSEGLDKDGKTLGSGSGRPDFTLTEEWTDKWDQVGKPPVFGEMRRTFTESKLAVGGGKAHPTGTKKAQVLFSFESLFRPGKMDGGKADPATLALLGKASWDPCRDFIPTAPTHQGVPLRDLFFGKFLKASLASLCGAATEDAPKIDGFAQALRSGQLPFWQASAQAEVKFTGHTATLTYSGKDTVDEQTPIPKREGRSNGVYEIKGTLCLNFQTNLLVDLDIHLEHTIDVTPNLPCVPDRKDAVKLKETLTIRRKDTVLK